MIGALRAVAAPVLTRRVSSSLVSGLCLPAGSAGMWVLPPTG